MNADQLDRALRDALHGLAPADPCAPPGIADRIVLRHRRRSRMRVAGAALGLTGAVLGTLLVAGTDGDRGAPPPTSRVSERSSLVWRTTLPARSWDACVTGPRAVHCRGPQYNAVAVDTGSGKIAWREKAGADGGVGSPAGSLPGVRDGVLYTYADHAPGATHAGTDLVALDTGSRRVLWKHELADDSRNRSSAVLFDGGVLANAPGFTSVVALDDRTGRTLWTYSWKRADCDRAAIGGVPHLMCSPHSGKVPQRSSVVRLDPRTGEPSPVASVDGPTVYLGADGDAVLLGGPADAGKRIGDGPAVLTRVDTGTGTVTRHRVDRLPTGVVADGVVLSDSGDGRVVAYSAADGRRLWSAGLGLTLRENPRDPGTRDLPSAAVVDLGRRVAYYLDPSGHLVGLDLDSGAMRWRGRVRVPASPVEGGIAPELMLHRHSLIGRIGGELFRIEPVPSEPRS